jgi:hypothetical protein
VPTIDEHAILSDYFMFISIEFSFCPNARMISQILTSMRKNLDKDTYSETIRRFKEENGERTYTDYSTKSEK